MYCAGGVGVATFGIRWPCNTIGWDVHGLACVPQPVGAGTLLSVMSSYAVSWNVRIWPLASMRLVATFVVSAVVSTIDVSAPRTSVPIAVATISSTRV